MQNDIRRLHDLLHQGKCCAVVLVQLALERLGTPNEQLLEAVSGLCFGMHAQEMCGALTGAACMLNVLAPGKANEAMVPELVMWFTSTVGKECGGCTCDQILDDNPINIKARCPSLIEATYLQAKEILADNGFDLENESLLSVPPSSNDEGH